MVRIAIVIPYASMANLAWDVFQEHTEQMRLQALDTTEYSLDILVASTTQELLPQWPDCDAMIARGATYLDLCRRSLSIPVIELIINGTDIVNTLLQLRQKYGPVPAAILGTQNMILGVEKLARQLGVDVTPYCFQENSLLEIRRCVEQAARDGKRVIIGGGTGCRLAEEIGLTSMLITSGREAFWNAISEAKQQAKISQVEREKALSFQTMLDNAYEGLVVIDRNQQISFLNTAAIQILQLSRREQYLGKPASSVFSTPALSRIVSATENTDEIIAYKNTHLSVKTKNMMMHGLRAGTVVSLLNAAQIQTTEDQLRKKLHYKGHKAKYTFGDIITRSPRMIACIQEAKAFAQTDSNIVVVGETGTGKELLSQSIHAWSRRSQNNFVAINCAALPENLLESELFGYVEGAFTGATRGGKPGLFEIAHNGTIFLDEISEIPLGLQGRLLRVLQEREIMRLGDSQVTPINIRVIAATNKNLESLVRAGKFRSDLYYRLYVLQLNLPPLRERQEDIPLLTQSFLRNFQAREGDGCPLELSDGDCRLLQSCPWRGNIRELQNFCERLAVLYRPGVSVSGLIAHLLESAASPETPPPCPPPMPKAAHTRIDLSYEELLAVLQECGGNRTQTAAKLGISRGTLWRLLKKYQVGQT